MSTPTHLPLSAEIRTHALTQKEEVFRQLSELVAFDSVHGESGHEEDCRSAAAWVSQALTEAGLTVDEIVTADGSIALVGQRHISAEAPTVLLYSHYDVVLAGERTKWLSDPFTLTEREGRWYGRGSADCKGNLVMHLAALRTLEQFEETPRVNLKVLIEGSEEQGGEGLDKLIAERPELFAADAILIADTGNAAVGKPTLTTSLRGGAQVTVTLNTLRTPVHSGMFGGAAPDAVAALVRLLNTLRDERGRTVIDGVDTSTRWEGEPYDAETFRADAGVLGGVELMGDESDSPADFVWARPSVTITGFTSTPVAEAVNAVPATASARLNLRVGPGTSAADTAAKLAEHLRHNTPWGALVEVEVADVNEPFSADTSSPALSLLGKALASAYGAEQTGTVGSGGSIPLCTALQQAHPEAEIALFGVEEPQSTIHSPNESVDPSEILHIAAAEALFLLNYGDQN
ncbi:putative succinyl-diaminopimelate desuccinylase [Corynebacterium occultum]|uniref:Putative succinyl-diaminopimelate desuccinylase n=1 Tax=Corynebacterium occultum TaxID=2675219 RepID=A0A6B8VS00_9CORY|nr:dipeptidase [Corynebacterium occultum]QGU08352.1 putative succinyl-diaminopimelate desuccinylase [Corynebacterium occultum]